MNERPVWRPEYTVFFEDMDSVLEEHPELDESIADLIRASRHIGYWVTSSDELLFIESRARGGGYFVSSWKSVRAKETLYEILACPTTSTGR